MIPSGGVPTLFPWIAAEHFRNTLPPLYERTVTLFVPTEAAVGPITLAGRVRFRTHSPYLLRALGMGDLAEDVVIYDLDAHEITVDLLP